MISERHGLRSVASDITDPQISEQALTNFKSAIELIRFPIRETPSALKVGVDRFMHGEFNTLKGTIPLGKRYLIGALNTAPALFSGEEGLGAGLTEHSHPQFILNFDRSLAAQTDIRERNYADHYNTTIMRRSGCHLSLGHSSVLAYGIARGIATGEMMRNYGTELTHEQVVSIHAAKPSKPLKRRVHVEKFVA